MLNLLSFLPGNVVLLIGMLFSFGATWYILNNYRDKLPRDQGREFAVAGAKSAGKPRGAGIVFIIVFAICALLCAPVSIEMLIYLVLLVAAMMTGYLDDSARVPWGELKKGLLDAAIALLTAGTYLYFNGSGVNFTILSFDITLPPVLFAILTIVLVWVSINVTNCADGVDGLSASLVIVTLVSFYAVFKMTGNESGMDVQILLFIAVLAAYLWFNATPSLLMMGDAGSRAMGFFIAVCALKSRDPFIYILLAIVLILDGGLGLIKVSLLRFLKIKILVNTRTPLHDHVRKNKDWSNTQTVFRFAIIQMAVSAITIMLIMS